jgi:hypothetical protein
MKNLPHDPTKSATVPIGKLKASRKKFGIQLKTHHTVSGLSLRKLADSATLRHSYIAALEGGRRGCGPTAATRLADAFHLRGDQRREFLSTAAATMVRPATNLEATGFEYQMMYALNAWLATQGTSGREMVNVKAGIATDESTKKPDLVLTLDDGEVILVDFMMRSVPKAPQGVSDPKPKNPNTNS